VMGEKEKIEELIKIIEKGSFFSEVKSVQVNFEENTSKFNGFDILH